jgi:hypothetical protein
MKCFLCGPCEAYKRVSVIVWATQFLEDTNTGTWPPGWQSLESETVKCGHDPAGLGPENDCADDDQQRT